MAAPPISEAESQLQGINASQQQIDDFRKNAALNALTQAYGPQAGDPDVWLKGSQASAAAQEAPYAGQTAQADLQGKQLSNTQQDLANQNTQRDQRGRLVYGIAQMAKGQAQPDGSMSPDAYDKIFGNPAVQQIIGATPDQIAQYKPLLTAPGGTAHLDALSQAAIGPQPLSGAFSYGTAADGSSVAIGHDKFGRPIVQGLGDVTPTAVTNAQSGAANRASLAQNRPVLPNGQVNPSYVSAKQQVAKTAASNNVTLTPEGLDLATQYFMQTGEMPNMGMGGTANKTAVVNNAAAKGGTGAQLADNKQQYKSAQAYETDLAKSSPTSAGGMARSAGAVFQHIDTLDQFVGALANKNVRLANSLSQKFREETGKPAPTAFDAQKTIVGDELTRYLISRGGTLHDRQQLQGALSRANSPEQLRTVIHTYRDDIGAQLYAQYSQASGFGKQKQFLGVLTPEARTVLTGIAEPGVAVRNAHVGIPQITGDADFAKLPSGAQFIAPDGSVRVKH